MAAESGSNAAAAMPREPLLAVLLCVISVTAHALLCRTIQNIAALQVMQDIAQVAGFAL